MAGQESVDDGVLVLENGVLKVFVQEHGIRAIIEESLEDVDIPPDDSMVKDAIKVLLIGMGGNQADRVGATMNSSLEEEIGALTMMLAKRELAPSSRPALSGEVDVGTKGEQSLDDLDRPISFQHRSQDRVDFSVREAFVSARKIGEGRADTAQSGGG